MLKAARPRRAPKSGPTDQEPDTEFRSEDVLLLRDKPGHLMRRVQQRSTSIFAEESREFGVTGPQHVIMVALAHHPGVDQNTVAELVDLDRSTTGDVLARLERRGLILRKVNEEDRRGRVLFLSASGQKMLQDMGPAVARTQERFLAPLSAAERKQFLNLLRKLAQFDE
ncbi:MarR family winged helix-turn-helix transcriptional regulator [Roseomonas chloroacetimidivorans]|uniref:MarR family winged helix-turn-helix transcriptional regulator n=1 Tax=Roseomonas chloroacetimidivorans TaxID=1766656 RepID=UPI003C783C4C